MEFTSKDDVYKVVNVVPGMDVVLYVNGAFVGEYVVENVDEDEVILTQCPGEYEVFDDYTVEWDVLYHQPRICIVIEPPEISDPDVKWDGISDHHYL